MRARGLPRNLGEPKRLRSNPGGRPHQPQARCSRVRGNGSEERTHERYREVERGAKTRGKDGRQSDGLVVPAMLGQRPKRPNGGKGATEHGTAGGKDDREIELGKHLNETSADS